MVRRLVGAFGIFVLFLSQSSAQSELKEVKNEVLRGRVVAFAAPSVIPAGSGPLKMLFIFETQAEEGTPTPVLVEYRFYNLQEAPPPRFFDYSNIYDLSVKRDRKCDSTVEEVSYEKVQDERGRPLPSRFILKNAKNAPSVSLKPDTALPCYTMWHDQYKTVAPGAPGKS
jgi:hypothetical protein